MKKALRKIKVKFETLLDNIFGRKDYKRFVIISRSRTGSNLLVSLLDSHGDISCKGELLRRLNGQSTDQLLKQKVYPKKVRALYRGFKLFYYHPQDSDDKSIWEILENDKNVTVLHLMRENLLRVHISRLIADKTGTYTNRNNKRKLPVNEKKITVDCDALIKDFEQTEEYIENTKEMFSSHKYMEVTYEELTQNQAETMKGILDFFDLQGSNLESSYKKQNKEGISSLVENNEALKTCLKGTKYEWMLEAEIK